MIRLFASLLVAGSFFAVAAQQNVQIAADQAHSNARPHTVSGEKGASVESAIVNFSELAAAEVKTPKKAQSARSHRPMPAPKGLLLGDAATETGDAVAADSLVTAAATALSPATATNFVGALDNGTSIPPDTMGAVGTGFIMVALNTEVKILTRGGGVLSSQSLNQFWSRLNIAESFDPKVYFDAQRNRWIMVACADAFSDASAVLVAVSQGEDPRGTWNLYKLDADTSNARWADYPSVGFNSKWIVVTMNMFPNTAAGTYGGANVWAIDKESLYSGVLTAPYKLFNEPSGFTMSPAVTFDTTEQTIHIVENFGQKTLRLSTVTGSVGQESLNVGVATVTSPTLSWNLQGGDTGQQLGTALTIECNDPRILNVVVRNGSIWAAHSVFFPANGDPTRAAAQWWELNSSGSILQQGLIENANASYAMPTIAVNRQNDVLVGYTKMAPDMYASAAYSFRASTDPKNTMQAEAILKAGEASYFKDFGSGENRWGDYSATVVDPLNDLDMWTLQEYASTPKNGESQWGVWWGMISLALPPDNVLEIRVNPGTGTDVPQGSAVDYFATVSDSYLIITNATVTAKIPGRPNVTFRNDGVAPDLAANDGIYSASITLNSPSESPVVFTATAPGMGPGSVTNSYNVIPRPANDNFANAQKIPSGGIFGLTTAQVPNTFATSELNEPLHAGVSNFRSLWWNYSSDTAAPILVDTSGSGPRVVIAVYTGTSLTSLVPVASTNPPPGKKAILKFDAQAGVTYRIAVAGADQGEKGLVRLRVQPNGEPDTTPPIVTVQFPPSGLVTNVATIEFRGTAIDPSPNPSGVKAVLIEDLQSEPGNVVQATLVGTLWTATITLPEATNTFRVHGVDFSDNSSAPQVITVYYRPTQTTTNDLFGRARPLTTASGVEFASNTNATKEFSEPLHGGNEGGASLWWTYMPTKSGVLLINTAGSDFDTLLAVYTVNDPLDRSLSKLIPLAQNDDAPDATDGTSEVRLAVEAGRLYYIAVDGYGGAKGNVQLNFNFAETGVFKLTTSSESGGTISPASTAIPAGGAVTVTATPDQYMQFSRFRITRNGVTTIVTNGPSYTFSVTADTDVVAEFTTKQFADDFQSGGFNRLPYQISSSATVGQHWVVASVETNSATHQGSLVARVREGLPDATTASLVIVTNLAAGVGSFEFTVNSETNYDRFEFAIDGRVIGSWTGFVPWQTFFFDIPAKSSATRLEWRYIKDLAVTVPNELVAIDNIDITLVPPPAPAPLQLTISADPGQVTITANGPANADFRLESSSDLLNWTPVPDTERNSGSAGVVTYVQPMSTVKARFYRVTQL